MAVNVSAIQNNIKISWTNPVTPRLIYPSDIGRYVVNNQSYLMPMTSKDWIFDNNEKVVQVASGRSHSAILLSDGTVLTCGLNQFGQLGSTYLTGVSYGGRDSLERVANVSNAIKVACGLSHTVVLLNTGYVVSFGSNASGQLGVSINSGTSNANTTPQLIPGITTAIDIACGASHTVILMTDGTIRTFGLNTSGQLGYSTNSGTTTANSTPVTVSTISDAISIAAGTAMTAVLLSNGTVKTFGINQRGQLGNTINSGTTTPNFNTVDVSNVSNIIAISCGNEHLVLLDNSGNVMTCGTNQYGNLGYATNSGTTNANNIPTRVSSLSNIKQIRTGAYHTIAIDASCNAYLFGLNQFGQLGNTTNMGNAGAVPIPILSDVSNVIQATGGNHHTLLLTGNGRLYTMGTNQLGQIATGKSAVQFVEDYVAENNTITSIVSGFAAQHSAIITSAATAVAKTFGFNNQGQICIGSTNSSINSTPQQVATDISAVAMGDFFTILLRTNGTVASFGYNFAGQAGNTTTVGTTTPGTSPYTIPNLTNIAAVSCGTDHTAVLTISGTVRTFGSNNRGQLGVSLVGNTALPQDVSGLSGIRKIVCGRSYTVAVLNNGTVRTFGLNNFGQLGHTSTLNLSTGTNVPTLIPDISNVIDAACGIDHTCLLLQNGQIITFGNNVFGQLGRNINTGLSVSNYLPTLVPDISNVSRIACGSSYTSILLNNGQVMTFGLNNYIQLGHLTNAGTTIANHLPTVISSITNAINIACGSTHLFVQLSNGKVRIFGYNQYGQLGNRYSVAQPAASLPSGINYTGSSGLPDGFYNVSFQVVRGSTSTSFLNSQTIRIGPLPIIQDLSGQRNVLTVSLSWSALSNVSYYKVYRRVGGVFTLFRNNLLTPQLVFTGVANENYTFAVSAFYPFGEENSLSNSIAIQMPTLPGRISALIITKPKNNQIGLRWFPLLTGIEKGYGSTLAYKLQYKLSLDGVFQDIPGAQNISGTTTTYLATVPSDATSYEFAIRASNEIGDGEPTYSVQIIPCIPGWMRVLTPSGWKEISSLKTGDNIITDKMKQVPIMKIYDTKSRVSEETAPYRFEVGSICGGYPSAPFDISPTHAIALPKGGWIIPKHAALSGIKAKQHSIGEVIHYYHVELPDYLNDNLVLEGGTVVESFGVNWLKRQPKGTVVYTFDNRAKVFKRMSGTELVKTTSSLKGITK